MAATCDAELSRNLLKEMGTVRNLRSLQQQNDRLAARSLGDGGARKPTHMYVTFMFSTVPLLFS